MRGQVLLCEALCLMLVSGTTFAQTATGTGNEAAKSAMQFDVVSIKPSAPDGSFRMFIRPDGYHVIGRPIAYSILRGYSSPDLMRKAFLVNAPDWVWNENYDFDGTIAPEDHKLWDPVAWGVAGRNDALQSLLQPMLQAALADRCKLVVHEIAGTTKGYLLEVANPKLLARELKPSPPEEQIPGNALTIRPDGYMVPIMSNDDPKLTFYQTSMQSLAEQLGRFTDNRVEDKTGMRGKFDLKLLRLDLTDDIRLLWDLRSLGLKLTPVEVPVKKVVVDHIERPTAN